MAQSKRKYDEMMFESDPLRIPVICYDQIFRYLPIESLLSVALTCKAWYDLLASNQFCFNKRTKLTLSNEQQLLVISNSKILRHINRIEMDSSDRRILLDNFRLNFTSLHTFKLRFVSLTPLFVTNLFQSVSLTLKSLILAMNPKINVETTTTCLCLLASLNLLPNLTYFFLLLRSGAKIEIDIDKYFKCLTKLEKLIVRQDNFTGGRSRIQQLNALTCLPNLKYLEWFEFSSSDLQIVVSLPCRPLLQYVHLQETLITNEILYHLSRIPTITSLKSHRFSPLQTKLNINGYKYLLALKESLKELQISAKHIKYDELMMVQYPAESESTESEYEVQITSEHVDILKQFIHLTRLSFDQISITKENMDNLLISLVDHHTLKVLDLTSVSFPSMVVLSQVTSLEELVLSYPNREDGAQYTDEDLMILSPLKNLRVLELYYSFNLQSKTRKRLKAHTKSNCSFIFEKLEEFFYNDDE